MLGELLSLTALAVVAVLLFLLLFEPGLAYRVRSPAARLDSREFVNYLEADFTADLASSLPVEMEQWRRRRVSERAFAVLARVFERQA